jgi:hypothetical protein
MAEPAAAPAPHRRRALVGLLLLAAALRLLSWQRATMMTNDGPDFLWQAQRLLDGDAAAALAHPYHPGYAALSAAAALLTRDVLAGALLVSVLSGVLATWAAVAAARELWPARPRAALAAGLLACVHGASLSHTADVRSDGLYLALFAGTCALLLAAARRGGWRWAAAGLAAGLAYLTRPEGLFLVLPAALALVGAARAAGAGRALAGGAAFLAGLALLSLPYLTFIRQHTGTWAISMKPSLSAAGLAGGGAIATLPPGCPLASALVPRAGRSTAAPGVTESPALGPTPAAASVVEAVGDVASAREPAPPAAGDAAREIDAGDARRGLSPGEASPARSLAEAARTLASAARWDVIVLAALGVALAWRGRRRALLAGLLVLAAWLAAAALHARASGYLGQRHMLGPVQLLFPAAGLGLLALWESRRLRAPARFIAGGIVVLAAFGGAKDRHRDDAGRLRALELARGATTPDQALVVHRRKDGWYAQRPVVVVELPCRDEDLAATMARENAVLLVLEEDQLRRDAPHWLDGSRFAEVARFSAGDEVALVLQPRD